MKHQSEKLFCFTIEKQQFAIPLDTVDLLLLATAVIPVPNSPAAIHGVINYHGVIVPVINLRHKLNLPGQPIRACDMFILADSSKRKIALVADSVTGVIVPELNDLATAVDIDPGFGAAGFLRREDGIVLIYDLESFLSGEEYLDLMDAMEQRTSDNV